MRAQLLARRLAVFVSLALVAGCAGRIDRGVPFRSGGAAGPAASGQADSYVWARNDGRRMADNPALLRLGQKDQSECRAQASAGANPDKNAYFDCMKGRGYSPRTP